MEYLSSITCFLGIALCFLPMMTNLEFDLSFVDDLENIPLENALSTRSYAFSLVSGIAVSYPIVLELIADIYSGQQENFQAVFSKWILLIALVIPNAIILLVIYPYSHYQAMPSICNARLVLIIFAFMTFMRNYGAPIWTPRITNSLMISMTTSLVIDSFEAYVIYYKTILIIIRTVLLVIPLLVIFGYTFIWLRHIYNSNHSTPLSMDEYCCNLYLTACIFSSLSVFVSYMSFSSASWATTTVSYLATTSYTELIFTVMITVWNGRTARRALLIDRSRQELETKRMFVRYVSHEIRTPLNTVGMGLTVLHTELSDLKLDNDMISIVEDLRNSTDIAVEILNDLLIYEKLTANILQLDQTVIAVERFVRTTVRPFELQARAKNIEFILIFDNVNDDVNIFGDLAKLSQVVRNLISNGLKFTKSEGHVTIRISTVNNNINGESSKNSSRRRSIEAIVVGKRNKWTWSRLQSSISFENNNKVYHSVDNTPLTCLRIDVTDTGPGISKENQKLLFKEIVQFNPGELQDGKGSGLGLWISSRIMSLHEGSLSVHSDGEGHGCTFTMTMPLHYLPLPPVAITPVELMSNNNIINRSNRSSMHMNEGSPLPLPSPLPSPLPFGSLSPSPLLLRNTDILIQIPSIFNNNSNNNDNNNCNNDTSQGHKTSFNDEDNTVDLSDNYHRNTIVNGNNDELSLNGRILDNHSTDIDIDIDIDTNPDIDIDIDIDTNPDIDIDIDTNPDIDIDIDRRSKFVNYNCTNNVCNDNCGSNGNNDGNGNEQYISPIKSNEDYDINDSKISSVCTLNGGRINMDDNDVDEVEEYKSNSINNSNNTVASFVAPSSSMKGTTVLLVDDAALNRKMLHRLVKPRCSQVLEAEDGLVAVSMIKHSINSMENTIDIILMDYQMPKMDGPTASKEIRKLGYTGLIIGVTGNALNSDIYHFISYGADKVIIKPLDIENLEETVSGLLNTKTRMI